MIEKGKLQNNVLLKNIITHTHPNKCAKKMSGKTHETVHSYWLLLKSESRSGSGR